MVQGLLAALRRSPFGKRFGAPLSAVAAVTAAVVLSAVHGLVITGDNAKHAAGHLAIALPLLALVGFVLRVCPPAKATRIGRASRILIVTALISIAAGLTLEAVGAFGYGPNESKKIEALTTLHNTAYLVQLPGLLALLFGLPLSVMSLAQKHPPGAVG